MKFYETMYIVHPILEMGRLHDLVIDIEKNISKKGSEVVYTNIIGKKRMAYPIQKQKFGTYILVQFKGDGSKNNEFNFDMGNNPNILRNMVITIDESEVKEQSENIKEQISGLSRPANSSAEKEPSKDSDETVKTETAEEETEPVKTETAEEETEPVKTETAEEETETVKTETAEEETETVKKTEE